MIKLKEKIGEGLAKTLLSRYKTGVNTSMTSTGMKVPTLGLIK